MSADADQSDPDVPSGRRSISVLLVAIIQAQDENRAMQALSGVGLAAIRLPSSGAFLSRHNVTLLIGMPADQVEGALMAIQRTCHERTEYVSTPLESAPLPIPVSTPITVGGAAVFLVGVDRFEEIV